MRIATPFLALALAAALFAGCGREPATTDEVLADVRAKAAKIDAYTADTAIAMKMGGMEMNFGGTMQGKGKQMITAMDFDMMGQKMKMKSIVGADGIMWMDIDMMGIKQVMKMDLAQAARVQQQMMPGLPQGLGGMSGMGGQQSDPRGVLDALATSFTLDYKGTEKLGDEDVYVLSGPMNEQIREQIASFAQAGMDLGAMMHEARVKIGKKDGFQRSLEMIGEDGQPWMTQSFSNIQLNPRLDDTLFTYTPAEGVQVMDMTQMMEGALQSGAATAPDEATAAPLQ